MRRSTLCYIYRGDQVLMLHRTRKKNDINHDKWLGIGGGIEAGESVEACLLREAKEETGLTLTRYRYRGVVDFASDVYEDEEMHLFTADGFTGELIQCDEGDLEWIDRSMLLRLPHWEGDAIFLKLLDRDAPFFRLRLEYAGEQLKRAVLNGEIIRGGNRNAMQLP